MKLNAVLLLKVAVVAIALAVLTLCAYALPLGIQSDIGGYRYILMGLYVPAIPFFVALYQAMKLLHYIDKNIAFSDLSVESLMNIKYCAIIISALFTVGMPYIYLVAESDDAPGVILIGLIIIGASITIATFAGLLQELLRNAIEMKSENDLTV